LTDSIVLSGNEITESYFKFSVEQSGTDFGYGPERARQQSAVLHYNVQLRRKLLNVFVTYLIPIVVALVMIFILLTACRKTTERQGIIESMAAFIFVLIFSHIDLRKEVVTGELIYLEYFYFITYAMVLLSTFNLMAYTLDRTNRFDFNDNQIFKACYFPLFLFAVLVVTLVKFY
jgi:CDP-diglyceride synthetase